MATFASIIMSTFNCCCYCYYGIHILEPSITPTELKGPTHTRPHKLNFLLATIIIILSSSFY